MTCKILPLRTPHAKHKSASGFTLIELSIVLVIIGLIVGGILTGRELINAAAIRSQITQLETYNTSVRAFQDKYGGIPGDLASTQAIAMGLYATGMTGAVGLGDGNGVLEGGVANGQKGRGENLVFWRHLSDAKMIDGLFGQDLVAATVTTANSPNLYYAPAKIGRSNYIIVAAVTGTNYFLIGSITAQVVGGAYTFSPQITPVEAYNIDLKIDDGLPNTGTVQAHGTSASSATVFTDVSRAGDMSV